MVNILGQFLMMNQFLGQNNHAVKCQVNYSELEFPFQWGANILRDILEGRQVGDLPPVLGCWTLRDTQAITCCIFRDWELSVSAAQLSICTQCSRCLINNLQGNFPRIALCDFTVRTCNLLIIIAALEKSRCRSELSRTCTGTLSSASSSLTWSIRD